MTSSNMAAVSRDLEISALTSGDDQASAVTGSTSSLTPRLRAPSVLIRGHVSGARGADFEKKNY